MSEGERTCRKEALEITSLLDTPVPVEFLKTILGTEEGILLLLDEGVLRERDFDGWLEVAEGKESLLEASKASRGQLRARYQQLAEVAQTLRLPEAVVAGFHAKAGQGEKARILWIRAAEKACDRKRYPEALSSIRLALSHWPWNVAPRDRVRILREMARCAQNAGEAETTRLAWQELSEYAEDSGNTSLQVEAFGQLAGFVDDASRAAGYLRKAAELAEANLAPGEAVGPLLEYVEHLANRVRIKLAREVLDRAVGKAVASDSPALISETRGYEGLIAAMAGDHAKATRFVEEGLRLAIANDLPEQAAIAYRRRANIAEYRGSYQEEADAQAFALTYCQQVNAGDQVTCLSCLAYASFRHGDWKSALETLKVVQENPSSHRVLVAMADCVEGLIAAFRGQRKTAEQKLHMALDVFRQDGVSGMEFFALMGLGAMHAMAREADEATRWFDELRALWRETDDLHDVIPGLLFAGGHYAAKGHTTRLRDCIDILSSIVRSNPLGEAKAALIALQGEQAVLDGDQEGLVGAMVEASKIYKDGGLPLEQAWVGMFAGHAPSSGHVMKEAVAIARRMGLRPLLALMEKTQDKSDDPSEVPCDLTPRQVDVVQLLANGYTSKEIADQLSLSTRTVEMHVSRLLERMNCRTRSEAVRLAKERGWL